MVARLIGNLLLNELAAFVGRWNSLAGLPTLDALGAVAAFNCWHAGRALHVEAKTVKAA